MPSRKPPFRAAGAPAEATIPLHPTRVIYAHNVRQTMRLPAKSQRYGCIRSCSGIRGEGDEVVQEGKRERGYGRWSGRERSGALRYQFCIFWRGCFGMVQRSGLVRQSVRFASDRHIVSRDNCYYSEILRNRGELFRD